MGAKPLTGEVEVLHDAGFVAPQTFYGLADAGAYIVAVGRDVESTELGPVYRLSKETGSVVDLAVATATASAAATGVAADATRAIWSMSEFESGVGFHRTLLGRTLDGGPAVVYYSGDETVRGAELAASEVLWLQGSDELWRAPAMGGGAVQLASLPACSDLAVGESAIYALCTEANNEMLLEISFDGSAVVELFSYATPYWGSGSRLLVSGGRLVWVDDNSSAGDSFVWKWEVETASATNLLSTSDVGGAFRAITISGDATFLAVGPPGDENVIWAVAE